MAWRRPKGLRLPPTDFLQPAAASHRGQHLLYAAHLTSGAENLRPARAAAG
jgi:hypothetical protein